MVAGAWSRVLDPRTTFIIAEAGVNHNGHLSLAKELIDAAVEAGADAVKFQTFHAGKLAARHAPKADYQKKTTQARESHYEMLKRLELNPRQTRELYDYCRKKNIIFLSSAFDRDSADFLDQLGMELFKIPSGELTNSPLLTYMAAKGKPVILSTGMACLDEIDKAMRLMRSVGQQRIVLLHCVSSYPTDPADVNLKAMRTLAQRFHVPVGFSDHTLGTVIALAAVALGARVVEKHFTLDTTMDGPDHKISLEPEALKGMVRDIRQIELARGDGLKAPTADEQKTAAVARRSLVAACDIPAGTFLSEALITAKRPGTGLPPDRKKSLIGRKVLRDIAKDQLISLEMLA